MHLSYKQAPEAGQPSSYSLTNAKGNGRWSPRPASGTAIHVHYCPVSSVVSSTGLHHAGTKHSEQMSHVQSQVLPQLPGAAPFEQAVSSLAVSS